MTTYLVAGLILLNAAQGIYFFNKIQDEKDRYQLLVDYTMTLQMHYNQTCNDSL